MGSRGIKLGVFVIVGFVLLATEAAVFDSFQSFGTQTSRYQNRNSNFDSAHADTNSNLQNQQSVVNTRPLSSNQPRDQAPPPKNLRFEFGDLGTGKNSQLITSKSTVSFGSDSGQVQVKTSSLMPFIVTVFVEPTSQNTGTPSDFIQTNKQKPKNPPNQKLTPIPTANVIQPPIILPQPPKSTSPPPKAQPEISPPQLQPQPQPSPPQITQPIPPTPTAPISNLTQQPPINTTQQNTSQISQSPPTPASSQPSANSTNINATQNVSFINSVLVKALGEVTPSTQPKTDLRNLSAGFNSPGRQRSYDIVQEILDRANKLPERNYDFLSIIRQTSQLNLPATTQNQTQTSNENNTDKAQSSSQAQPATTSTPAPQKSQPVIQPNQTQTSPQPKALTQQQIQAQIRQEQIRKFLQLAKLEANPFLKRLSTSTSDPTPTPSSPPPSPSIPSIPQITAPTNS